jgi:hypothetical protein
MKFIDYVIQSGRAVMYPIYKGTYERPAEVMAGRFKPRNSERSTTQSAIRW